MPNDAQATLPSWSPPPGDITLPTFSMLRGSATADVVVIGAGIGGLTSAYLLARAGKSVLLLDDPGPSSQRPLPQSQRTSAHLASYIDDGHSTLESTHGEPASRLAHQSHAHAIDFIESAARTLRIPCDFRRLDAYLFPIPGDERYLEKELEASRRAGLDVEQLTAAPRGLRHPGPYLRFRHQARFQPRHYLAGLTRACLDLGVRFSVGSVVTDTHAEPDGRILTTAHDGSAFTSAAAVVATNVPSPVNNWLGIYLKAAPYRTYMVALQIDPAAVEDALLWDTGDPYHYVRLDTSGPEPLLLVGGEDHKVGQPPTGGEHAAFQRLEAWAREHFPAAGQRKHAWSGQVIEPNDDLAYLGVCPTQPNTYVITGDSGMGLTHGTLGGIICSDLILGRPNPYAELYSPARKPHGLSAFSEFAKEQLNVAAQYTDLLTPGDVASPDQIPPGSGAVIREGTTKVAIYRGPDGSLSRCSAVCTHLGCIVRWNPAEHSWDCPCHGSRFDPTGRVIAGPAVSPLKDLD